MNSEQEQATIVVAGDSIAVANGGPKKKSSMDDHIVLFPFMAKGHTIPLLRFAAALAGRGIQVTVVTTPANVTFIRQSLAPSSGDAVHIVPLPFPRLPPILDGCESTDTLPSMDLFPVFLTATTLLHASFSALLRSLPHPPLCVISDFFLGWTLEECRSLGIPRIVFHGMGAFSMALCKALWMHRPHDSGDHCIFTVPGAPQSFLLSKHEVPNEIQLPPGDPKHPVVSFIDATAAADVNSWGVLVNSFADLEASYVPYIESFYFAGARAWLVGPMSLLGKTGNDCNPDDAYPCMHWLDGRLTGSVVYVSFGSQASLGEEQMEEVAAGLEESGWEYLLAVRSLPGNASPARGKIVPWTPQREVLEHPAVGGFVTHCGWNSCMEGIAAGVPMLVWPMNAEQPLNAKLVVEVFGAGIFVPGASSGEKGRLVTREEIAGGVREMMDGKEGERARTKVAELRRAAAAAVETNGSSRKKLDELLDKLRRLAEERNSSVPEVDFSDTPVLAK